MHQYLFLIVLLVLVATLWHKDPWKKEHSTAIAAGLGELFGKASRGLSHLEQTSAFVRKQDRDDMLKSFFNLKTKDDAAAIKEVERQWAKLTPDGKKLIGAKILQDGNYKTLIDDATPAQQRALNKLFTEVLYAAKIDNLDAFRKLRSRAPKNVKGHGKKFGDMDDDELADHAAYYGSRASDEAFDTFHLIKALASKNNGLEPRVLIGRGVQKATDDLVKTKMDDALESSDITKGLKDMGISNVHHFEDVARALNLTGEQITKGIKAFPLNRNLLQRFRDTGYTPGEALLKKLTDPKKWYQDWKTIGSVGTLVLVAIIIPLATWLFKSPVGAGSSGGGGGGGPNEECTGLCRFLNDPSTAPIAGTISWLSLCCCCCCCCLSVMMIVMGDSAGRGGGNNNLI